MLSFIRSEEWTEHLCVDESIEHRWRMVEFHCIRANEVVCTTAPSAGQTREQLKDVNVSNLFVFCFVLIRVKEGLQPITTLSSGAVTKTTVLTIAMVTILKISLKCASTPKNHITINILFNVLNIWCVNDVHWINVLCRLSESATFDTLQNLKWFFIL